MRKLKRPLSILIAALLLVSVMVIAPVTAGATATEFPGYEYWVPSTGDILTFPGDDVHNYYRFARADLKRFVKFVRLNPAGGDALPDWSYLWGESEYKEMGYSNVFYLSHYYDNSNTINSYWQDPSSNIYNYGEHIDDPGYDPEQFVYLKVNKSTFDEAANPVWYAFTWTNLQYSVDGDELTISGSDSTRGYESPSNLPWASDLNHITSIDVEDGVTGLGKNVLGGCPNLESVTIAPSVTSIDPEAMDNTSVHAMESATFTRDAEDPMKDFGSATPKKLETLGVQLRTVDEVQAFRFVTIADSSLLKAADDYGYILAATNQSKDDVMSAISDSNFFVGGSNNKVYSCKNTSNNFAGDYGSSDLNETRYKYVSCIVTGASTGQVVVSRFYITLDGTTYTYAPYSTYNGCAYALS